MVAIADTETVQNHGERIAALENNQQHLATKADLANLQATLTWRLIIAVSIATAILGFLIQTQ
ncbi:MAG: hypothetical protein OXG92_11575 [Chloroflexi bacterium]|nr:hypothetical protein [Chloroflexota bacterium]MCY3582384.1 hypothetical protein [Chloroflexota bacterium]MCY3717094.1 hypothetical protein [Chloroflexota bacterium]MDE2650798.1 hypothetical protein [Chloroflexota bacterium]MXV93648.1 hypothetical protein [Chloroflexota bacterium]